jgi:hypothetical protein
MSHASFLENHDTNETCIYLVVKIDMISLPDSANKQDGSSADKTNDRAKFIYHYIFISEFRATICV